MPQTGWNRSSHDVGQAFQPEAWLLVVCGFLAQLPVAGADDGAAPAAHCRDRESSDRAGGADRSSRT